MMRIQNFWDQRYCQNEYVYGTCPNDFLVESFEHIPNTEEVLCIGDGEGRNSVWLAQQGLSVTSIDLSHEGKKKALRLAKQHNVQLKYFINDLAEFEFGNKRWGAIIAIFCHMPHSTRKEVFISCFKALKPGGVFILESYAPQQLSYASGGPKDIDMLVDLNQIKHEFVGFELLIKESKERNVTEGSLHHGLAFVTRILAKKLK